MRLIYLFILASLIAGCGKEPESPVSDNNSDIEDELGEIFSSCSPIEEETKQYDDISVSLIYLKCPDSAYESGYTHYEAIKIFNSSGKLLFFDHGNRIRFIDNKKLPSLVFHLYQQSNSYVYHVIYGFDTAPTFRQAFMIETPKRPDQSDWEIEGFYEENGIVMIDRLEEKEINWIHQIFAALRNKPICYANACVEYNVETYGWIDGEMKLLRTRDLELN